MNKRLVVRSLLLGLFICAFIGCSRDPNVRKQKYLESGQRYFTKGAYTAAVIQFRNALQADPAMAPAHYELARTYIKLQDWADAFRELNRTVELQPQNYEARLELSNLLIAAGQIAPAQEHLDQLLAQHPEKAGVHSARASLLGAQQDLSGAIAEMKKALAIDAGDGDLYLQLAVLQLKNNEIANAETSFKKAITFSTGPSKAELALGAFYQSQQRFTDAEQQFRAAIGADAGNPECRVALGRLYIAEGKTSDAEEFLRKSKADFPNNSVGYRMLGDFYFANGDFGKATAEYADLYRVHPTDIKVAKNYVQLLIIERKLDEASRLNDEILKSKQDDVDALIDRGQIQIAKARLGDAVNTLQSAIKADPNNGLAHYHLGIAFDRQKRPEQAEKEWRDAARLQPDLLEAQRMLSLSALRRGDMVQLEVAATEIVRLQPQSAEGYAMRALSHIRRGQMSQAESDVQQAIAVAPQSASGFLQLGNLMLAKRNFANAEEAYQQALERDEGSVDALSGLMNTYFAEQKPNSAFAAVRVQIAKVPSSSAFYDLLGTAQFDRMHGKQDIGESAANLQKSVELDEHNVDAWLKLAQVKAVSETSGQAIDVCHRGLEKNPDEAGFYVLLGELYVSQQKWTEAKNALERALVLSPQNPAASNDLAFVMMQTGENPDMAMPLAETARRGLPDSPQVADTMGWVFYQKGAYDSAVSQFQDALKLGERAKSPENPTVHFHLGMAYEKLGEPALARQHLQRVLKINPDYSRASDVKKLLSELKG